VIQIFLFSSASSIFLILSYYTFEILYRLTYNACHNFIVLVFFTFQILLKFEVLLYYILYIVNLNCDKLIIDNNNLKISIIY